MKRLMSFLNDLFLFLEVRRIENDLLHGKNSYMTLDGGGYPYKAFAFHWRGKYYICDWQRLRRDGALAAITYEMNRQQQIDAMTPEDWAEIEERP
jgi:hypothetical protein